MGLSQVVVLVLCDSLFRTPRQSEAFSFAQCIVGHTFSGPTVFREIMFLSWPKNVCWTLPCENQAGNRPVGTAQLVLLILCYSLVAWQTQAAGSYRRCPVPCRTQIFRPGPCFPFGLKTCVRLFRVRIWQATNP